MSKFSSSLTIVLLLGAVMVLMAQQKVTDVKITPILSPTPGHVTDDSETIRANTWMVVGKTLAMTNGKLDPNRWIVYLSSQKSSPGGLPWTTSLIVDAADLRRSVTGTIYVGIQPGGILSFTESSKSIPGVEGPFANLRPIFGAKK